MNDLTDYGARAAVKRQRLTFGILVLGTLFFGCLIASIAQLGSLDPACGFSTPLNSSQLNSTQFNSLNSVAALLLASRLRRHYPCVLSNHPTDCGVYPLQA